MSRNVIHINDFNEIPVPYLTDEEALKYANKGWSFSYIYSLRELRDVFILIGQTDVKSLKNFTKLVSIHLKYENNEWNERKVLEYLNALVNFKLITQDYHIRINYFSNSSINEPLSESDKVELRMIFFSYFRFKEIAGWFIDLSKKSTEFIESLDENFITSFSSPLFYFSKSNRFSDAFFKIQNGTKKVYVIPNNMSHLMRFWDVFLNWGNKLDVLERFNLSAIDYTVEGNRLLSVVYFKKPFERFNLIDFINNSSLKGRNISIPDLVYNIAINYRFSVQEIKEFILSEIQSNDNLTYERASEIFIIKGKSSKKNIEQATYLYPKYKDYYISHLIIRKKYE